MYNALVLRLCRPRISCIEGRLSRVLKGDYVVPLLLGAVVYVTMIQNHVAVGSDIFRRHQARQPVCRRSAESTQQLDQEQHQRDKNRDG